MLAIWAVDDEMIEKLNNELAPFMGHGSRGNDL